MSKILLCFARTRTDFQSQLFRELASSVRVPSCRDPLLVKNYFSSFGAKLPRANSVNLQELYSKFKKKFFTLFQITHRARQLDAHALFLGMERPISINDFCGHSHMQKEMERFFCVGFLYRRNTCPSRPL